MPEKTIAPSASKTNADVIPVRRVASPPPLRAPMSVMGFAYARSDGRSSAAGTTNGSTPWTLSSPMHVGIVGEAVTHLAAVRMMQDGWLSTDDAAFSLLGINAAPAFSSITVGQLVQHKTGMAGTVNRVDYGLGPGVWLTLTGYIAAYLAQTDTPQPVRGSGFQRNFIDTTVLSAVLDVKAVANGYANHADYVRAVLLTPMGDGVLSGFQQGSMLDAAHRTLAYSSAQGTEAFDWENHGFFAWYNWVATPQALLSFMANVRSNDQVLSSLGRAALLGGTTAWRVSDNVTYIGGNNTWTRDDDHVPAPYPGLAVAAASYTPPGGTALDAVLFVNSPYVIAVDDVVDSLLEDETR